SLSLARSEAIKRNGNVTVTPVSATDWGQGWAITSAGGEAIRSQAALKGVSISVAGTPASVVYARSGRANASPSFQIDVSATATSNIRCIKIELSGMPRTVKGAC
ncbi:MAG: prepilin-type cleavage/methylation domain-containing protein, partial [Gallionella sp.]